jgi:hypothetical protein
MVDRQHVLTYACVDPLTGERIKIPHTLEGSSYVP